MPLNSLLSRLRHAPAAAPSSLPFPRKDLAVAVLLIEASQVDRRVSPIERDAVARLVRERFALPQAEAQHLVELAGGTFAAALDDWVFTQAVHDGFTVDERGEIFEMIWEVVYADGQMARFEELFMQRLVDSLGLSEQAAERARGLGFARINATSDKRSGE